MGRRTTLEGADGKLVAIDLSTCGEVVRIASLPGQNWSIKVNRDNLIKALTLPEEMISSPTPPQVQWDMRTADMGSSEAEEYMADGWQPFSTYVDGSYIVVALRKQVVKG